MEYREIRVDDNDVVSVAEENSFNGCLTSIAQHIVSKAGSLLYANKKGLSPWFGSGVKGKLLKPEGQWIEGKFFFRIYFVPNEPPKEPDPFK